MEKSQENLNESLNKIKYLINYDSSKTRIENTESIISEQVGAVAGPQMAANIAAKQSLKMPRGTSNEIIGSRGEATIREIDRIAGNINWELNTKASLRTDSRNMIAVYNQLRKLAGKTYKGKRAIEVANEQYQRYYKKSILDDIEKKSKLNFQGEGYKKLIIDLLQGKEEPATSTDQTTSPDVKPGGSGGNTGGYKFVIGTSDDPYRYGTLGSGIGSIQQTLGLAADGKWGPKTDAKIKELAPEYAKGFTNGDLVKVAQAIRAKTQPESQPIARSTEPAVNPKVASQPSSKSLSQVPLAEQKKKLSEQTRPGEMLGKTAAVTGGALAAGGIAGAGAGIAGSTATGSMAALGVGSVVLGAKSALLPATAITAVGGGVIAGAAALALTPLVLWLIDKDKARPKVQKLFKYVEDNKTQIDQVPRGLSDEQIWDASDQLFIAMKRLGTREKAVYRVFESLKTISDLSALITFYNQDNKVSLMKQLDRDFNMTKEWMKIYRPIRNLVLRFAKEMAQNQPETPETSVGGAGGAGGTYKFVDGSAENPYKYGTKGHGIVKVQECLGLKADGLFGPKTKSRLSSLGQSYDQFTNEDVATICKMARQERSPITVKGAQGATAGPVATAPKLTKNLNMTSLAPTDRISNDRMRNIVGNVRRGKKYVGEPLNPEETDFVNNYISKAREK
ncbi:MAG TPA: hypothetical protein PK698_01650 [Bacilli bacterium]|nr:hypothetical protein [Bacilli bacterium]